MTTSLLAAVHAAANDVPPTELSVNQPKEIPTMTTEKPAVTTVAELTAAFPDLCAAISSEAMTAGATIERGRILGIAALSDAGNAALIADMQADGKTTPGDAAIRVLGAQKQARGQQLQAIVDVDKTTGAVKPAPSAAAAPGADLQPAATGPDGWKAEYAKSEGLQAEFETAEAYCSYQQGVASGRIKRLQNRQTA